MLTVDLQVLGQRHRDIKNGMTVPPEIRIKNIIDIATKPAWALEHPDGQAQDLRQSRRPREGHGQRQFARRNGSADQFDPALNWKDVEWIKKIWPGKLILKGILDAEDAKTAVKLGADAIVVSNHGGRQLDGAPSSISALPEIADAVGADTEVLFDGGIRTGADIMRALALGARACMIGRAYIYGLGAGGQSRRRQGDRHSGEGTQRRHGADRHQPDRRYRPPRDRGRRAAGAGEEAGTPAREGGGEARGLIGAQPNTHGCKLDEGSLPLLEAKQTGASNPWQPFFEPVDQNPPLLTSPCSDLPP